ncbi:MAG: bifunctional pyr operon transcriptional regulator/uracil phosphoribosyltransferase PyrR [Cytophagales bacterium]|nr:bifunctional pyr operon transcriptional regulator/uracil phosphoribosyltransferase PyrR [Cytophagales bacterium]
MQKVILDKELLEITINRLCQQLIENHNDFENSVLIGLQPKGVFLAERIKKSLKEITGKEMPLGCLDVTFFRDDFRRRNTPLKANATDMPFLIEGKRVVFIDDVLFSGRSIRAALDAMTAYGRPAQVELLVLVDRKYTRELPIQADYVGTHINSMLSQAVVVQWEGINGNEEDSVVLLNREE